APLHEVGRALSLLGLRARRERADPRHRRSAAPRRLATAVVAHQVRDRAAVGRSILSVGEDAGTFHALHAARPIHAMDRARALPIFSSRRLRSARDAADRLHLAFDDRRLAVGSAHRPAIALRSIPQRQLLDLRRTRVMTLRQAAREREWLLLAAVIVVLFHRPLTTGTLFFRDI